MHRVKGVKAFLIFQKASRSVQHCRLGIRRPWDKEVGPVGVYTKLRRTRGGAFEKDSGAGKGGEFEFELNNSARPRDTQRYRERERGAKRKRVAV